MNGMKRICWTLLFACGMLMPVRSDDFEDFIQVCATVSGSYKAALMAPDSRFEKEFQTNIELLKKLSRKNYDVIRRLQLGQDLNFPLIADEFERIYEGQKDIFKIQKSNKPNRNNKSNSHSGRSRNRSPGSLSNRISASSDSPEGILRVLADDVKALRKMEFTTEDGGSIKSSLETRRRLMEFRRLVDFLRKNYRKALSDSRKDPSLNRIFKTRLMRMSALATLLMEIARTKYPDSLSQYNLQQEVAQVIRSLDALQELWDRIERNNRSATDGRAGSRKKKTDSDYSLHRIDGLNNRTTIYTEIEYGLKNINQQLIRWEQSGFQSDDPISRGAGETAGDPASVMQKEQQDMTSYDAMDPAQLDAMLQKRRQEIIRSNSSMDGFDREAEQRYLLTLSRDQRRRYGIFLRDFQQQGYSVGESTRNAILKIHTQMKMEPEKLTKKELLQIMKALDKNEERRLEKNDIKFKLVPGRVR